LPAALKNRAVKDACEAPIGRARRGRLRDLVLPVIRLITVVPVVRATILCFNRLTLEQEMARKSRPAETMQSLSVSGNAAGLAQVAGDNNTVTAMGTVSASTPVDVLQALAAIQAALASHPATKVLTEAAVQQAKAKEPDRAAIGTQLRIALDTAKTTLGWVELAKHLVPHIQTVAAWLGTAGEELLGPWL
jgi:hypothetical protein